MESQVLAVENPLDRAEVGVLAGGALPRQRPKAVQVGAHLRGLGGPRRQTPEAIHLALDLTRDQGGQSRGARGGAGATPRFRGCQAARAGGRALGQHATPGLGHGGLAGSHGSRHPGLLVGPRVWRVAPATLKAPRFTEGRSGSSPGSSHCKPPAAARPAVSRQLSASPLPDDGRNRAARMQSAIERERDQRLGFMERSQP